MNQMRKLTCSVVLFGASASLWAQDTDELRLGAAQLFDKSCAQCHTVPDPSIPMDLAWLDQVRRTS